MTKNIKNKIYTLVCIFILFFCANAFAQNFFKKANITDIVIDYAGKVFINGEKAVDGDEIGVFVDDGNGGELIVGSAIIGNIADGQYFVHIYGDDSTTPKKDGAMVGDQLIFRFRQKSSKKTFIISPAYMKAVPTKNVSLPSIPPVFNINAQQVGLLNIDI